MRKRNKFTWSKIEGDYYAYYGDEELGFIEYYKKWRKWVWNQGEDVVMSLNCWEEVGKKLRELTENETKVSVNKSGGK